jgi:hypothetical protein
MKPNIIEMKGNLGGFQLLKGRVPEGHCPDCLTAHEEFAPHNQQSLHYQMAFREQHGRWPTWHDAMRHCDAKMKELWLTELAALGVDVGPDEHAPKPQDYITCQRCHWIGTMDQCEDRPGGKFVGESHKWCPKCGKTKTFVKVPAPVIYPVPKDLHELKALSIRQPWAWLIVHGPKRFENREWSAKNPGRKFRGRVLIHAGQGMTQDEYYSGRIAALDAECEKLPPSHELRRGGIIGVAEIAGWWDYAPRDNPWAFTSGFVLDRVQPLTFIPCKGALGFFKPDLSALESEVAA